MATAANTGIFIARSFVVNTHLLFVLYIHRMCPTWTIGVCSLHDPQMKPEPIYGEIGALVRRKRRQEDISQQDLAKRLGISRATLASIETGRQRILVHVLSAIARELHVQAGDLLPPPPSSASNAESSSALLFSDQLNADQKRQLMTLIGAVETESKKASRS